MAKRNKSKMNFGPITIMICIGIGIAILSFLLNKLGTQSYITDPDTFETTIITVKNIFSREGIRFLFGESISNFRALEPLAVIVVSLIAVTILEVSGLLNSLFGSLKNVKPNVVTFFVLLLSVFSTVIGDYSYAILFPFVALLYKNIGRDPKMGVITAFIGITMGYGGGFLYTYQDVVLGKMAENAAIDVLGNYLFEPWSMIFIEVVAALAITILGTILIEKKFPKKYKKLEEKEYIHSPKALAVTMGVFTFFLTLVIYAIIPGLLLSGWLLDSGAGTYMEKLFGVNAPFREGILVIFLGIALICGYIYGKISRNIKSSKEYNKAISLTFQNTGFIFAGLFFFSVMINILEWTNLSDLLSLKLINFVGQTQMSGIFLILLVLLVGTVVTIINPTTVHNFTLLCPTLIPLLIRANISPSFSLMMFKAADSIGKCFTPFYVFFIVMIGFLYKYDTQDEDITLFGTMRKIMPITLWLALVWFIIIIGWNLLGFRIGMGVASTL